MMLGIVTGTVVCTVQHPFYEGRKQLIVSRCGSDNVVDVTDYVVAIDMVGAGVGEMVLVQDEGTSARQVLGEAAHAPVRALVVGIVDAAVEQ
jgi:ethanolamine utilization protein EutN